MRLQAVYGVESTSATVPSTPHAAARMGPPFGPNANEDFLANLARRFGDRTDISVQMSDTALVLVPTGEAGFPITVQIEGRRLFGDFGGCRQDFETLGQIETCIDIVLAGDARLRIDYRDGRPNCWTLEDLRYGAARVLLSCGFATFVFWPFRSATTSRHFAFARA